MGFFGRAVYVLGMARPTKHAGQICLGLSILVVLAIVWAMFAHKPLILAFALLPVVAYEIYRTEGETTKWASWVMGITAVALILFTITRWNFDLANFLGQDSAQVGDYLVPLGDIATLGAVMLGALAVVLFRQTRGVYTRWLSVIIIVGVLALVYLLNPDTFGELVRQTAQDAVNNNGL
jgi:hypothetical protein